MADITISPTTQSLPEPAAHVRVRGYWESVWRRLRYDYVTLFCMALIVLIVPLVGIAAGWLQLGERPTGPDAIGMALILAGIAVMVVSQRRKLPVTAQAEG